MTGDDQFLEKSRSSEYVALLPAAGIGSRLPQRRLSKELLPFGSGEGEESPVISHLLRCVQQAGIRNIVIVLRQEKRDIPDYLLGDGWQGSDFSYEITAGTSGVPETVALGLRGVQSRRVFFGFPDILFEPTDAPLTIMRRLDSTDADVVLGLFPTDNPGKFDMVQIDDEGQVINIEIKPESTSLDLTWILAAWRPTFSAYLHNLVGNQPDRIAEHANSSTNMHLGHVFQLALSDGLRIDAESFPDGRLLDIGTPDDLALARSWSN